MRIVQEIGRNKDYRRLLDNFVSLFVLQGLNYVLPLITFPYLVRVLGVERFGLLAFVAAMTAYFKILTDYGFNLSATRQIAVHRENTEKVRDIVSAVLMVKLLLLVVSFVLLLVLVLSFERFSKDKVLYFLSFGIVVGQVLFPVWFFQGVERMRFITVLNLVAKVIFTVAIFVFVRSQADYWKVPLLNSIGFIVAGLLSLLLVVFYFKLPLSFPGRKSMVFQLKEGWHVFVSTVAISLYTVSTTFILGLFTNNVVVGYYAAADKLISVLKGLMEPVSQTIYPFIAKKMAESVEEGLRIVRRILKYASLTAAALSCATFFLSGKIVTIVLGSNYEKSILLLRILAIHPVLVAFSNLFGVQVMLNLGMKKAFQNILIAAGLVNIALSLILVPAFHQVGSALAVTFVEAFVSVAMYAYLRSSGVRIFVVTRLAGR